MAAARFRFPVKLTVFFYLTLIAAASFVTELHCADSAAGPVASPVQVAVVQKRMVAEKVSLIGTTEPIRESTVAAEVSGRVDALYVSSGDFVKESSPLAVLSDTDLKLRLKAAKAVREMVKARLILANKELERVTTLKDTNSVAAKQYDEAYFNHSGLSQELVKSEAEIERLEYELSKKKVLAPFAGFIAEEHTQVGEWVNMGGGIVNLVDLSRILIKVDVPEKHAVKITPQSKVDVAIKSLGNRSLSADVLAVLPKGNAAARTFPVHIRMSNADLQIKSGMEALVMFNVGEAKTALLVPKDAVVAAGSQRLVYVVNSGKALPVPINVLGYYGSDAAIEGGLKPGQQVITRGNERLRPGQPVQVIEK